MSSLKSSGDVITEPQVSFLDEKLCDNFTMAKRTYINSESGWVGGVTTMPMVTMASVQTTPSPYRHVPQVPEAKPRVSGSGGRRVKEEFLLDPEEMEKRRIRRERNKLAAARCRKRRVDQIESLQKDVDEWEERKRLLQEEIASLQQQRDEFQFVLDAHKSVCKQNSHNNIGVVLNPPTFSGPKVVVKSEPEIDSSFSCDEVLGSDGLENFPMNSPVEINLKPQRPVSLSLKSIPLRSIEGVSIDTPTACLNFDSLIDGRTGLTPTNILTPININVSGSGGGMMTSLTTSLTPSCGTQQRHQSISISAHCASMSELSSPTTNSPNLVSL